MVNLREGGNVLAGGCQENGCQALQWNVSLNRYRAALEHAIQVLGPGDDEDSDSPGNLAHAVLRHALEGPADA